MLEEMRQLAAAKRAKASLLPRSTVAPEPGAKWRAQIRTAADRGTPMPRCQGGCCLANAGLERSANSELVGDQGAQKQPQRVRKTFCGCMAPPGGIEPTSSPEEGLILSIELRRRMEMCKEDYSQGKGTCQMMHVPLVLVFLASMRDRFSQTVM